MNRYVIPLVLTVAAGGLASMSPAAAHVHAPSTIPTAGHSMMERPAPARRTEAPLAKPRQVAIKPGNYRGNFYTSSGKRLEEFTFKVTKSRKVKKLTAALNVTCSYYPPTVETHPLGFPTTSVKADGTFRRVWTPNAESRIVLTGTLKRARLITGSLDYTVGVCVRSAQLEATRIRPAS